MKVGDAYFSAWVNDGRVEIDERVLRTIRGEHAFFVKKIDGLTWGKRSKKTGDYGWLDPLPVWARDKVRVVDGAPRGYGKSKSAAIRLELADRRKARARHKADAEIVEEIDGEIRALERRLSRVSR